MINRLVKKSVTRQFGLMAAAAIILFSIVIGIYVFWQNAITEEFKERNRQLDLKENATIVLNDSYNKAISEFRAYFAYGQNGKNKLYYNRGMEQKETVLKAYEDLEALAENDYDRAFLQQVSTFYQLYFLDLLPKTVAAYERGNTSEVTRTAVEGGSERVRVFQTGLEDYSAKIEREINENRERFTDSLFFSQILFLIVLIFMIGTLIAMIRRYLRKMQQPLQHLTAAAGEIAAGKDVIFDSISNRQDELGLLHIAFSKMSKSIAEKEQDLTAQNEELIAQQDELQVQQDELRSALEKMWERESQLTLRNELSNSIANTLDKQKLLTSIITAMCRISKADKGIVIMADQPEHYAAVSLSDTAVRTILGNMNSGLIDGVKKTKQAKVYKRIADPEEIGYHESPQYSYDLYLPVLSSGERAEAIMILTKFNEIFGEKEIVEYISLTKNIALSLDKLKLYEQAEQDREMVRHILNTIHEGIQLVDLNGVSLQVNTTMSSMLSCRGEELAFASFDEWFSHFSYVVSDSVELEGILKTVIFSHKPVQDSFTYRMNNGTIVNLYAEPLYRNGRRLGTVMVHRDITKEYEVDQMKSEFVSTVSHELRTPLASVLGFTELLLYKDLKPERRKKYLSTIYQEGKRLTSLINNFLDVQRLESGKQTYEKRLGDLSVILGEVVEEQQILTSEHRFYFHTSAKNAMVLGDRDMLKQAFQNLAGNAVKYSPDGGNISVILFEENGWLKVEIKDEGLGIPEDAKDKLFTKFYRIDNSDRRKIGGTGLGLSIVKEIIKAHSGEISVHSKLGEGSTFTVSLPLHDASGHSQAPEADGSSSASILIIENDENFASLLKAEFEEMGLSTAVMLRGDRALSEAASLSPDAVVLDILLSDDDLTGWDVMGRLKQVPHLAEIPVFISTALNEKEKAVSLGAAGYLTKPYQPGELIKLVIKTILDRKNSLSEREP
ncbi:ATP-binding protein [Metabacillus indicus]|uniref:ATP-binding protein n=1 Tax=Metabacillus indicus TaxID=246786 RepID=UPI002A04A367|nr:ATP-binding protein [Metabacillus indicus]MDX8290310.1 ATP-binding protein [Metabacillus indicus]